MELAVDEDRSRAVEGASLWLLETCRELRCPRAFLFTLVPPDGCAGAVRVELVAEVPPQRAHGDGGGRPSHLGDVLGAMARAAAPTFGAACEVAAAFCEAGSPVYSAESLARARGGETRATDDAGMKALAGDVAAADGPVQRRRARAALVVRFEAGALPYADAVRGAEAAAPYADRLSLFGTAAIISTLLVQRGREGVHAWQLMLPPPSPLRAAAVRVAGVEALSCETAGAHWARGAGGARVGVRASAAYVPPHHAEEEAPDETARRVTACGRRVHALRVLVELGAEDGTTLRFEANACRGAAWDATSAVVAHLTATLGLDAMVTEEHMQAAGAAAPPEISSMAHRLRALCLAVRVEGGGGGVEGAVAAAVRAALEELGEAAPDAFERMAHDRAASEMAGELAGMLASSPAPGVAAALFGMLGADCAEEACELLRRRVMSLAPPRPE